MGPHSPVRTVNPDVILTDARGRPFERPRPQDHTSFAAYVRAHHAYRDKITAAANEAFDRNFARVMAGG